ncbi:MAG: bifunctional 3,4-dihydroxy-2-butanone-4-phosphate synthase/GTP cyclohydrolase II [Pseudomonadota bacterium]
MALNSIEEIIADLRDGRMVIIVDDEDRENEGDLLMLAEKTRPEDINFMARYGRGLICLTLTQERCRRLRLPLMVTRTQEAFSTNFTVSIEAAEGVTTGISAADRARTVQAAVAPEARPEDLVQPGHIFPLMAQPGGVLTRAGHTEAGCDLARLAGAGEAAAVIVEILNEDGTMARRPDLEVFAAEHGLKIGSIEDLIRYRLRHERTVERVAESDVTTAFGKFRLLAYHDPAGNDLHFALVHGQPDPEQPVPVRVHLQNTLCDVLALRDGSCGWPLSDVMRRLAEEPTGVAVILRLPEDNRALVRQIRQMQLLAAQPQAQAQATRVENGDDLRTFGVGAQILQDIGVRRMRVMSAPKRFHALAGFGLEIVDYIGE